MKKLLIIVLITFIFSSCKKIYEAPVPDSSGWDLFDSSASKTLSHTTQAAMEGIYALTQGNDIFGSLVAIKWSYIVDKRDTTYHISGFFGKDIAYFICEGKQLGGSILFNDQEQ